MNAGGLSLSVCALHGHHTGRVCPRCDIVPAAAETAPVIEPESKEDRSSWWNGPELELHEHFATWLGHHEVEFIRSRPDKPSTIEKGWPDFTCLKAKGGVVLGCLIEFKTRSGKLRKDQVEVIARLESLGISVLVTGEFQEACDYVRLNLLNA